MPTRPSGSLSSLRGRMIDAITTGIAYVDRNLVFRLCNATQARYFGRTVDQVIDHPLCDVVAGNQEFWRQLEQVIETGESQPQSAIAVTWADRPEEGEHHYLVAYVADTDERGDVRGVFMTAQDITESVVAEQGVEAERTRLQRLTEDLQDTVRERDVLVGALSHELRTPLTTIFGNADILVRRLAELDEASRNRVVADIREEAGRLGLLVENMLLLARAGLRSTAQLEPIVVRHFIRATVLKRTEPYGHRKIRIAVTPKDLMAVVQASYLRQVLSNLLDNATKYSPADAAIDIRARRRGSEVVVSVLDRGSGFAAGETDIIFQPFYRSNRTAAGVSGAGIGLAVCKLLVQAQSGRIWARPRRGGGSIFSFTVPAYSEPAE